MVERNDRWGVVAGALILGAVIGVLLLSAARLVALPEHEHVHHHANWAVFINGERLDLTDMRYMEDVFQCTMDPTHQRPEDRVHMHEGNHDVVHVHASGVTWGHLLANLGFGIGDDFLHTDRARFETTPERSLKFVLNGSPVRSIRNLSIGDQDRLLISYGPESVETVVADQYPLVAADAGRYNEVPDPASCSGAHEETFGERVRRAVWF
jgi:hypothetical protein